MELISSFIWDLLKMGGGYILGNYKNIILGIKSIYHWNEKIRFSISYLFRIKINNKYLLIKGSNIEQLQPVGGVYKVFDSFKTIEKENEIIFENEKGFYEENDLRFRTKGKYIKNIIKWFNSRLNREISVSREFYEELIINNILPLDSLVETKFEFIKQVKPKMAYSTHFGVNEILIFEIFEVLLSEEDKNKIINQIEKGNNLIKLVDWNDIEHECVEIEGQSRKIGAHTKYII